MLRLGWLVGALAAVGLVGLVGCGGGDAAPAGGEDADVGADGTAPFDTGGAGDAGDATSVDADATRDTADRDARVDADATVDTAPPPAVRRVYVATGDGNVGVYALDAATGALALVSSLAVGDYPSFAAIDRVHHRMYAVLEASDRLAALSIAPTTGALTALGTVDAPGGPTHVSLDHDGRHVMIASYGAGTTTVFPVNADGTLGAPTDRKSPGANSHQIVVDPAGGFAFVPNKGSDDVAQFVYDPAAGTLTANAPATLATAAGAGPRHLDFHPGNRFAYLMNENDSTLSALGYDAIRGLLTPLQTVSTLPAGVGAAGNTGAEVHVSPSGSFVYGSNRGNDSIAVFAVDAAAGTLSPVGHASTGKTPRHFTLDPTGTLLVVADQGSNDVLTFRVDVATGLLTRLSKTAVAAAPYWVGVVDLP